MRYNEIHKTDSLILLSLGMGNFMLLAVLQRTELKHYFAIRSDLVIAVRDAVQGDIAHHIDELQILAMHTDSARLRRACAATIAEQQPRKAVAHA